MSQQYNPIVRTFNRFRAELVRSLGLARHEVRPDTPLGALIPEGRRREVWEELWRHGFRVPAAFELTPRARAWLLLRALHPAVSLALWLETWLALLTALPFGLLAYLTLGPRAWQFTPQVRWTVGEMVLYLTSCRGHRDSGYRWTRNEISFKVRLIVAESLGVPLEGIRPETSFVEDIGAG